MENRKVCCANCVEYSGAGKCFVDLPPWATAYANKYERPPVKPDDMVDCEMFFAVYHGN